MLLKYRPYLMALVGIALAVLVWLDNQPEPAPAAPSKAITIAAPADDATAIADGEPRAAGEVAQGEEPAPDTANGLALTNPLATLAREDHSDWVTRPLFAPTRKRPPEKQGVAVAQAAPASVANYELLGIMREGTHALALLRNKVDGASVRVEIGDVVGGWRIAKIEKAAVVIERGEGLAQTLPLQR